MMWERRDLKMRAKARMSLNYWKCVLVALIVSVLMGGAAGSGAGGSSSLIESRDDVNRGYDISEGNIIPEDLAEEFAQIGGSFDGKTTATVLATVVITVFIIFFIIFAIAILIKCFLVNPLSVGCKRFFYRNLNEEAQIKEVCFNFDYDYFNGVKVMFFMNLYTVLWTLLFIIPGIVKSYEYKMIPYILAEQPDIDKDTAFAISRQMMSGNKWKAFVLDLSFLGWQILNTLTLGILGIFYVNPYMQQTYAALYETLKMNYNYKQMEDPWA